MRYWPYGPGHSQLHRNRETIFLETWYQTRDSHGQGQKSAGDPQEEAEIVQRDRE